MNGKVGTCNRGKWEHKRKGGVRSGENGKVNKGEVRARKREEKKERGGRKGKRTARKVEGKKES